MPPPPTSIFIFLLSLSIFSPSLFKKKKKIFFFGGGGSLPPGQLIPSQKNCNSIKYVHIPSPPPNIHFHLIFFINSFPSLFKKKKFFWGGGSLPPGQLIPSQKNCNSIKYVHIPHPPPPNIHFYLPSFSFYLFSFTFQNKNEIFFLGGGYHLANSSSLKNNSTWPIHLLSKNCNCIKYTNPPPPPTSILIFFSFLNSFPSL